MSSALTNLPRARRGVWPMAGALVVAGLVAGCGSSGSGGSGKSGAPSCTVDDSPTRDGDSYKVTLKVPHGQDGYYAQTATVTTSGGSDGSSTSSEPLNTEIPLTLGPGTYRLMATIAPTANAPTGSAAIICSTNIYVN